MDACFTKSTGLKKKDNVMKDLKEKLRKTGMSKNGSYDIGRNDSVLSRHHILKEMNDVHVNDNYNQNSSSNINLIGIEETNNSYM